MPDLPILTKADLTEREYDILLLLAAGLSNSEIAERLMVELSTVKWYNRQIYNKLGANNRREAVQTAEQLGLSGVPTELIPARPRHNLPAQTTPFIGRETELDELTRLLNDPQVRLMTILASGGMGKSRLALEVAARYVQETIFEHGVWFVDLSPLRDKIHVPDSVGTRQVAGFGSSDTGNSQYKSIEAMQHIASTLPNTFRSV